MTMGIWQVNSVLINLINQEVKISFITPSVTLGDPHGDYTGYGLSQWQTMLHCNAVSHWLSQCPNWFILRPTVYPIKYARIFLLVFHVLCFIVVLWAEIVFRNSGRYRNETIKAYICINEIKTKLPPYHLMLAISSEMPAKPNIPKITDCKCFKHMGHYNDVTMSTMASQMISLTIVYSTVIPFDDVIMGNMHVLAQWPLLFSDFVSRL